jgi:nitroreductase
MAPRSDAEYFLHIVKTRRTAREYLEDSLPAGALEQILEAARWAPSAANTQPWELIVIDDNHTKSRLREAYLEEALPHDKHYQAVSRKQADLITAPVLIAVCGDPNTKNRYVDAADIPPKNRDELFILSIGAAIQNMLLIAESLGVGSTWIARLARVSKVRQILQIPNEIDIVSFVALGFTSKKQDCSESLRIPIHEKTHHNVFGGGD